MTTKPQKYAAQRASTGKWVSGWYVEVLRAGGTYVPHIYTDDGQWMQIDASTLRPLPQEGNLF
jgi:hypothetical protein